MKKFFIIRTISAAILVFALFLINLTPGFGQSLNPNQMLIRFQPGTSEFFAANYKNSLGAIEIAQSPVSNIRLWYIPSFSTAFMNHGWFNINEVVNGSSGKAEVNSAGFNYDSTLPYIEQGPSSSSSMDPTAVCPEFSIYTNIRETTVKVAILDTGIGYTGSNSDPQFCNPGLFAPYYGSYIGYDFVNNDTEPRDDQGHGSHIAGIIAQMAALSPDLNLELMSFKTHNELGQGNTFNIIMATDQAVLMGANIINMSFSFPANGPLSNKPDPLQVAIDEAGEQGVLVVAAAGNINPGSNSSGLFYPAAYPCNNIISVASVNCDRELSTFSAWGIPEVDVAMLGESIQGPHFISGNMVLKSGTSQAAAIVSGIAAQLASNMSAIHHAPLKCSILSGAEYSSHLEDLILTEGVANAPEALTFLSNSCNLPDDQTAFSTLGALVNNELSAASSENLSVFPNPFSNVLSLSMNTAQTGMIAFSVYNVQGEVLHTENKVLEAPGTISFSWIPDQILAPGLYFTRIQLAGQTITRKVVKND